MHNFRNIIILLLLGFAPTAMAQVGLPRCDFSVGVSGGVTLNQIDFNPRIKQQFKFDPEFGVAARYVCEKYFNSICAIQLEANLQTLGWQELIEDGSDNQYKRNMRFIEVPFLMQMGWGKERKGFKFLFEAGPYLQYRLGMNEVRSGNPWRDSNRPNNVIHQYYYAPDQKFAYGIEAGIGLEHSSILGHFLLEARYNYGLSSLYDDSKSSKNYYFTRSSNMTIEVKLTYLFDLIKTKQQ